MYLIEFWNETIYNNVQRHVATFSKHPEWEGKVELIAISIADSQEAARAIFESKGWSTKSTALWAGVGGLDSKLNKNLRVNEIPTSLVIQHGRVLHRCHPGWQELKDELEANMVRLLASEQPVIPEEYQGDLVPELNEAEIKGKMDGMKVYLAFIAQGIASNFPCIAYNCSKTFKPNGETYSKRKYRYQAKLTRGASMPSTT
jgi:hypothetical protein